MKFRIFLFLLLTIALALPTGAQKKKSQAVPPRITGLSLTVDAGLLIPKSKQANFYNGKDGHSNTINRVLKSELYGTQIWSNLVNQQLISPSAIPDHRAFTIAEDANMYYRLTYQLGVGVRYDYNSGWGWFLRFDYSQVTAAGQFLLSSNNGTGILGSKQYVPCDIYGREKRIFIDLAIAKKVPLTRIIDLEFDLGFDLNNTKVTANGIRVGGQTYSILDVWGGMSPVPGSGTYEYFNEGGMGIGGFGAVVLCYRMNGYSIDFGYGCSYVPTIYKGYNDGDAYALQHNIFFRFNINNFNFLSK